MSDTVEDTKRKLQELEQRIRAAKSSLGAKGEATAATRKGVAELVRELSSALSAD